MILPVLYDVLSVHEKRLVREEYIKLQEVIATIVVALFPKNPVNK